MESIALDTAACQKCLESASSFGSMTTCFSKLAHSTANFAVANAECSLEISKLAQHIDIYYFL